MASAYIDDLRKRIGDTDPDPAKQVWADDQLDQWIAQGISEWSYGARSEDAGNLEDGDVNMGLKLAHSSAMYELASGTALFFKWRDQQKEIDKSATPESCRRIGKDLWEQVNKQRQDKKRSTEEDPARRVAQGGTMQFDPGSGFSDRTPERPWK